jgi:hypothetical protein
MNEDEEVQPPPTSIEIGTLPFATNKEPEKETETIPVSSEPDTVKMEPLSKEAEDAYTTYIKIKKAKPSEGLDYLGITVIIAGIVIGFMTLEDDYELAGMCCFGGCFIGIILMLVASANQNKWRKEKKLKLEEALVKAGIPDIPRENQKPLGTSLVIVGLFALYMTDFFYNNYIVESVVFLGGLGSTISGVIILLRMDLQDRKAMKKRIAILEQKRNGK